MNGNPGSSSRQPQNHDGGAGGVYSKQLTRSRSITLHRIRHKCNNGRWVYKYPQSSCRSETHSSMLAQLSGYDMQYHQEQRQHYMQGQSLGDSQQQSGIWPQAPLSTGRVGEGALLCSRSLVGRLRLDMMGEHPFKSFHLPPQTHIPQVGASQALLYDKLNLILLLMRRHPQLTDSYDAGSPVGMLVQLLDPGKHKILPPVIESISNIMTS
jgi:hypothetical protein